MTANSLHNGISMTMLQNRNAVQDIDCLVAILSFNDLLSQKSGTIKTYLSLTPTGTQSRLKDKQK